MIPVTNVKTWGGSAPFIAKLKGQLLDIVELSYDSINRREKSLKKKLRCPGGPCLPGFLRTAAALLKSFGRARESCAFLCGPFPLSRLALASLAVLVLPEC